MWWLTVILVGKLLGKDICVGGVSDGGGGIDGGLTIRINHIRSI